MPKVVTNNMFSCGCRRKYLSLSKRKNLQQILSVPLMLSAMFSFFLLDALCYSISSSSFLICVQLVLLCDFLCHDQRTVLSPLSLSSKIWWMIINVPFLCSAKFVRASSTHGTTLYMFCVPHTPTALS